ncbi:hypothetical protein JCM11641_007892 [Rhodosporidiobolus odoratus]
MGYVGTFCQVSACSPTAADDLKNDWRLGEAVAALEDTPRVAELREAVEQLVAEEQEKLELTVIGPIEENGESRYTEEGDFSDKTNEIVAQSPDTLRVVFRCRAGSWFEFGSVSAITSKHDYLISYGPCFFVMTSALPILLLATQGRLTLERVWHLAMKQGRCDGAFEYVLSGVSYGAIEPYIEQFVTPLPGLPTNGDPETVQAVRSWLERGKTVEALKKLLTHEGGFWMWMSPDNFPLTPSSTPSRPPSLFKSSSSSTPSYPKASLPSLPFDLMLSMSSLLPLASIFSLASTCRTLRQSLFATSSNRDRLASSWLRASGRYWLPLSVDLGPDTSRSDPVEIGKVGIGRVEVKELAKEDSWWEYTRGMMIPENNASLTEEMQSLESSDYHGAQTWESLMKKDDDEEDGYPFPLVLKKGRGGSISGTTSGLTTPGGVSGAGGSVLGGPNGRSKTLSENDLAQADAALSHHSAEHGASNGTNGTH